MSIGHDTEMLRECYLCARPFTSHAIQCFASARFTDVEDAADLGIVCDDCIAAGPEGIRGRIDKNAEATATEDADEEHAEALRRLRDAQIIMPSLKELRARRAPSRQEPPRRIH